MSKKLIPILAALVVTAASAQSVTANGFSYDNIQGFYQSGSVSTNVDGSKVSTDLSGFGVSASSLLNENVFITASFGGVSGNSIKIDGVSYPVDTDASLTSFGLGYRLPVDSKTDFNLHVSSDSTKVEANVLGYSISETDRNTAIGAGLRYKLNQNLELNAHVEVVDGDVSTGFGGAMNLSESLSVIGGFSTSNGSSSTIIGLRVMY